MKASAEVLLEGPRGRRLCLELAMELDPGIGTAVFGLGHDLDPGKGTSRFRIASFSDSTASAGSAALEEHPSPERLAAMLASLDPTSVDDDLLQKALERSVGTARYWEEPDGEDVLAAFPVVRAALAPLAERVLAAPGARWWGQPRRADQWAIDWRSPDDPPPFPKDPHQTLEAWGRNERAEEARAARERPRDPHANWSGSWWSVPTGLVRTVGQVPAALSLVEDSLGWEEAATIPVHEAGRTLEIRTAENWVSLCRAFPLEVTASRRHDWFHTTGRDGRWVIPDWEHIADQWDAVHLTVLGYLNGATRALAVDADTATMIAGWDPDSTIWLSDVPHETEGPQQAWHRGPNDDTWTRTPS